MKTNSCSFQFPDDFSVYDFHIDAQNNNLVKWIDTISEPIFDREKTYDEISVPTEDSLK